ncbi:CdaR family protein [Mangrovimonas sp. YM274]|uniref:CdaR family protein n=1 Tax=Mangrovimonas sp. YM274 TaxID=3070660 RepID=UPI0027DAC2FD|nr:YbbR-like domain-containing protein [Mangrovimonas sp. YM274]WMI67599.1 YbbR-like domain-containing protein [Mangrovimonas sp. YM274]
MLSFLFLIISKLSGKYTETVALNVSFENVPENKVLLQKEKQKINVVLSANGFNLVPLIFFKQPVKIDYDSDLYYNNEHYSWVANKSAHKIKSLVGSRVEMLSITPDTLNFRFETLETKKVPIKLQANISYLIGYDVLDKVEIKPDSVTVIGAENIVSTIEEISTEPLSLKDVNASFSQSIALKLPKVDGNIKLSSQKVTVTSEVVKFTEGAVEVPVTLVNTPKNLTINYFPKVVTVLYYVPLNRFNEIKPSDFKVVCNYEEIAQTDKKAMTPKLTSVPEAAKSTRIKQNKVEFIVVK